MSQNVSQMNQGAPRALTSGAGDALTRYRRTVSARVFLRPIDHAVAAWRRWRRRQRERSYLLQSDRRIQLELIAQGHNLFGDDRG